MNKLAVYGTLRSKDSWGGVLSNQKKLGDAVLPSKYALYNLGNFPAVSMVEVDVDNPTVCEVYEVDDTALLRCDQIEGHPSFYERQLISIEGYDEVWVYILDDHGGERIYSGDWFNV